MSWDCPENKSTNKRSENVAEVREEIINTMEKEENTKAMESLMLKRILVKSEKKTSEPTQRKSMFRTVCKSKGKCCKVVIDSGSIDNLVSIDIVEKMGLKRMEHSTPYRVSGLQKGH